MSSPSSPSSPSSALEVSNATTKLAYNEGATLPSDAPTWAITASQRIKEKLESTGKITHAVPPPGVTKVLLHSCCAPCSGAMVEEMVSNDVLDSVVVFFYNPNIHPRREYEIRKVSGELVTGRKEGNKINNKEIEETCFFVSRIIFSHYYCYHSSP
jgi:hypothetical protein